MSEILFCWVELFKSIDSVWAVIIAAFVHNYVETDFPAEQCSVAMRAVIFSFSGSFITIVSVKVR